MRSLASRLHWRSRWRLRGVAIYLWEAEGEDRFGDEFALSAEEVADLDDEWRLAYIARLLCTALGAYGVSSQGLPGRDPEGELTPPITWTERLTSPAQLLRGLNDILHGLSPSMSNRPIR
jgi:hypothetical protein